MTTWKEVYSKLKNSRMMNKSDETSSEADTATSSGTPNLHHRPSLVDQEWQMNYIINRRDGLPKVKKDRNKEAENTKRRGFSGGTNNSSVTKGPARVETKEIIKEKVRKTLTSSFTQTDPIKTKVFRDVLIDSQSDLIHFVETGTETDFDLIALKAKDGQVRVTSSISTITDNTITHEVSSQTVMPRSNVSFRKFIDFRHRILYEDDEYDSDIEAEWCLENIERRLKTKKKIPLQNEQNTNFEFKLEDDSLEIIQSETIPPEYPHKAKTVNTEYEDSIIEENSSHETVINESKINSMNDSTINSWNNLDYEVQEEARAELPKSYFVENGPPPWSNYESLVLGQRFLNARMTGRVRPKVCWSDSQLKVITDLMSEANALMDVFDQVAMLLGPDIKLHKISDVEEFELPPNKYNDEMSRYCEKLEDSLKRLQQIQDSKAEYQMD